MKKVILAVLSTLLVLALAIPGAAQTAITQIPTPCTVGTIYSYTPQGGAYVSALPAGNYVCGPGGVFAPYGGSGGNTQIVLTDLTNATATAATFLSWPILASTSYAFSCEVFWQNSSTTLPTFTITAPTSPTSITAWGQDYIAATTDGLVFSGSPLAFTPAAGSVTGSTTYWATITGSIQNGTTAGTLAFQFDSSANTMTVKANSSCTVRSNP